MLKTFSSYVAAHLRAALQNFFPNKLDSFMYVKKSSQKLNAALKGAATVVLQSLGACCRQYTYIILPRSTYLQGKDQSTVHKVHHCK